MIARALNKKKTNKILKWFHNMGTGRDIKKVLFGRTSVYVKIILPRLF